MVSKEGQVILNLESDQEVGNIDECALYSAEDAAKFLGVTDRTLRNWASEYRWVFYFCLPKLIQAGKYTKLGILALADFQRWTQIKVPVLVNGKTVRNPDGKVKTIRQEPPYKVGEYAIRRWKANNVPENPNPFSFEESTTEAKEAAKQIKERNTRDSQSDHYPDGDLDSNTITTLVYNSVPVETEGILAEILDDVGAITTATDQSYLSWAKDRINFAKQEGEMLGTVEGKVLLNELHRAKSDVLSQATPTGISNQTTPEMKPAQRKTKRAKE